MARGWHVKHVAPPGLGPRLLLALSPEVLRWALNWLLIPRDYELALAFKGGALVTATCLL